ncbi:MAG: hypothetical protein KUG82_13060 [Pseudomonadales bacterium]|nr:hypothetical protein [Pseudomonadales bacterium]
MHKSNFRVVEQYLTRYAEAETQLLETFPSYQYDHCLVIPAFRETSHYIKRLFNSNFRYPKTPMHLLAILVLNCPNDASHSAIDKTQKNLDYIHNKGILLWQRAHLLLFDIRSCTSERPIHVLVVNRITHSIPKKQGVGLARKIGADIACYLYHHGMSHSPWIHSTDGDAQLPDGYFQSSYFQAEDLPHQTKNQHSVAAALIYPFSHENSQLHSKCSRTHIYHLLYECHLFHYQLGLQYAGSPYGFQTVGSTLAVNTTHYAMVRGFPKLSAGEDFYMLNKLIKTSHITSLTRPVIKLESRDSNRNPFGTGPSVKALLLKNKLLSSGIFYDPMLFKLLKKFIGLFPIFSTDRNVNWQQSVKSHLGNNQESDLIISAATTIQFEKALIHSYQQFSQKKKKPEIAVHYHLNVWFDGFRTLKWLHALREKGYNQTHIINAYNEELYPISSAELGLDEMKLWDKDEENIKNQLEKWLSAIRHYQYKEEQFYTIR